MIRQAHGGGVAWGAAVALVAALVLVAIPRAQAGSLERAMLATAERAFAKSYEALVPRLNKANAAVIRAVGNASKDSDAQIATIFGSVAREWTAAIKPLLALKAPAPEASVFATVTRLSRSIAGDLRTLSQAGSRHSVKEATSGGRHLARDFNALGAAIKQMKRRLGLP